MIDDDEPVFELVKDIEAENSDVTPRDEVEADPDAAATDGNAHNLEDEGELL